MKVPCKNCEKRHFRCHSGCSDYEAYIEELEKIRKRRSEDKKVINYHRNSKIGGYFRYKMKCR